MSTIDHLARWRLVTWLNRMDVVNTGRSVVDRDRRVWCLFTRKVNRLWSLTIVDLPTILNSGVGLDGLVSLTIYRITLIRVVLWFNVVDMDCLILLCVGN